MPQLPYMPPDVMKMEIADTNQNRFSSKNGKVQLFKVRNSDE
jgi:hypothetical protein